jgi:hypothetical protein
VLRRQRGEKAGRERERNRDLTELPSVENKKKGDARIRNRGEGEKRFPKDLCAISENCKGLSVKHKFHINLKP